MPSDPLFPDPPPPDLTPRPDPRHDERLQSLVRPEPWTSPEPAPRYNLVVVGGGPAGLVAAAGAAGLGAKVALIERQALGGDCLHTGCVPSKALLAAARVAHTVRHAGDFGVRLEGAACVDFPAVMERLRRLRADLAPNDSAERFRSLGVDVFFGEGRFVRPDAIEVGDRTLRFAKAVVATGSRAAIPPIPGLDRVPYLTHESVFSLPALPARLGILGAGPIGCELAQAFARLGSVVTLLEAGPRILPREDREAAAVLHAALEREGVRIWCNAKALSVAAPQPSILQLEATAESIPRSFSFDSLLVATGRLPNVERLDLQRAGIAVDPQGIRVDDRLRTTNPKVFACGDVCALPHRFTHAADFQARAVLQNALFGGRVRASDLLIPHCTYTSPEIAQIGLTPEEAEARGLAFDTWTQAFAHNDRSVLEGDTDGFVKVITVRGTDRILGAVIVGEVAGELIGEISVAMKAGLGLRKLASAIHPYPTRADAIRRLGDLHNRSRLTPTLQSLLGRWMGWQRR